MQDTTPFALCLLTVNSPNLRLPPNAALWGGKNEAFDVPAGLPAT